MKRSLIAFVFVAIGTSSVAQSTPEGLWRNIDDKTREAKAEIRIAPGAAGALYGRIEKALVQSVEPNCTACTDDRKNQPKLGLEIIRGARKSDTDNVWEGGRILDPENGKEYTLRMTPLEGGRKLQVRGFIGPFFRTQVWVRVQ